jgi:RHS repeat-associated protein
MISATSIEEVGFNRFRVRFAPQTDLGQYQVTLGPDIRDLAGNILTDIYEAAFNLVQVDLGLSNLHVQPNQLFIGDPITVAWTGRNASGAPLVGSWIDAVYLSTDDLWDIGDTFLGMVPHDGGLSENQPYSASLAVPLPGMLPGYVHFIVRADLANQEREAGGEADNIIVSAALPVSARPLGTTAVQGTLTQADRFDYFAVQLSGGESLNLRLTSTTPSSITGLYVSYTAIPTRIKFDQRSWTLSLQQEINLTGIASGGTYYVLVYGEQVPRTTEYTITAETAPFHVTSISPHRHGNASPAVVTIAGSGFDESVEVHFVNSSGTARRISAVFISPSTLKLPVVPLLPAGVYTVRVTKNGSSVELPAAFEVVEGGEARLETNLVVPGAISPGFPNKQTLYAEYRNSGDVAMPAPLLQIVANSNGLLTTDEALAIAMLQSRARPLSLGASVQVLGVGSGATPGILQPGDSGRIPLYYVGQTNDEGQRQITFSLGSLTAADTTEIVAYVKNPDERVVYDRPRHGRQNIDVSKPVEPFRLVRADTGSGVGPPSFSTSSGGGGGGTTNVGINPPNVFEEFLTIDWYGIRATARPATIPPDAWDAILYNLRSREIGDLWAFYVRVMADNADYLASVSERTSGVGDLWAFEVAQASASINPVRYLAGAVDVSVPAPGLPLVFSRVYGQSIPSRFRAGPLGRGWTHNWDFSIDQQDTGVTLRGPGGVDRFFALNQNGTYSSAPGDFGSLTIANGVFRLTETDRTIWQFRAGGLLDYVEDTNGNRITLAYVNDRLASIMHSSGQQIAIEYNQTGPGPAYITRVIDTLGPGSADDRLTTYDYNMNAAGPYLRRVTAPGNRVTEYTYAPHETVIFSPTGPRGDTNPHTPVSGPLSHALLSVTHADGTHDYFAYDDRGRLTETKRDGDAERVTFSYDAPGSVVVTDATGRVTRLGFGLGGQLAQVRDGDGRIVEFGYDDRFQFTSLTGPGGERYHYSYDNRGNLTGIRDALNLENTFEYEANFNRLGSFTDARGNGIQYEYDPRGNLTAIVYVDGSRETFTQDTRGNVLTATNRRGQTVTYTYNAAGQVETKGYDTTPGIVDYMYRYDTAGNLTEAIDANGTLRMAYDPATDRLTRIEYPGGQWFEFEYNAAGQRTKRTDQAGHVTNYNYDLAGRLDTMTDENISLIVDYDYDPAGRLVRKTLGNGVYTTYEYDAAGNVLSLINYQPGGVVLSQYDYTYDVSGRRTSMTTVGGTFEYGYDALGQLIAVRHPDGHLVTYQYDAAGNRRWVNDDGIVTTYSTNELNQYVTVGDAKYEFDADGNLISKTDGEVVTTYQYDIENRLVEVSASTDTWVYSYGPFGNRIATTHNGVTTEYVIDPLGLGDVAAEYDSTGNLLARYEYGFGLLSRLDATGDAAYYTFQVIGHTSELSDAAGVVLNSYTYDPFGISLRKTELVANSFEYVGEYGVMSEANDLEFMRARFYTAAHGRFIQEDPLDIVDGPNLYLYARNGPLSGIDPSGLSLDDSRGTNPIFDVGGGGGGGGGGEIDLILDLLDLIAGPHVWEPYEPLPLPPGGNPSNYDVHRSEPTPNIPPVPLPPTQPIPPPPPGQPLPPPILPPIPPDNEESSRIPRAVDPNDKLGPAGFGDNGHVLFLSENSFNYTVRFENQREATGPAREIIVTDVLEADLDLSTFELTEIAFADHTIRIPSGLSTYETLLPLRVMGIDIVAEVKASLDRDSRELRLSLRAIDPLTGWFPENPLIGLLYPNDDTHRGEGHISFIIKPSGGLASGTEITNRARIYFDYNDPIDTPLVRNTIDAGVPQSRVHVLPATTIEPVVELAWSGEDEAGGSGIAGYDIYVSIDGSAPALYFDDVTFTTENVILPPGHTYAFYSIARDNVGHVELPPSTPDATIEVRDIISPHVSGIFVRGSTWSDEFVAELAARGFGNGGYAVPVGSCSQLVTVPWANVDQIVIEFDENVAVEVGDLTLNGLNLPSYALRPDGFSYDAATRRATWTLAQPIAADKLLITLSDDVTDASPNANVLDGDWTNVLDSFPSGNGSAGSPFRFSFNVLPGDYDRNERTENLDFRPVLDRQFTDIGHTAYDVRADLDGTGFINILDLALARDNQNRSLPLGDPRGNSANPGSVAGVILSGSSWPASVRQVLDPTYGIGYVMPVGSCHQFDPLPWSNVNQVSILFTENMVVAAEDLSLYGVAIPQYALATNGFSYDAARHIATWTFNEPMPADKLRIVLSDNVHTTVGSALDGEWTDLARTFSSGDGTPGGGFVFRFNVLPGDMSQSGETTREDIILALRSAFMRVEDSRYSVFADLNNDGIVKPFEIVGIRNYGGRELPPGEPSGPVASPAPEIARALAIDRGLIALADSDQASRPARLSASRRPSHAARQRHRAVIDVVLAGVDASADAIASTRRIDASRRHRFYPLIG